MQEVQQLAQRLGRPFGDDAHGTVGLVGHPADQVEPARFLPCELPKVDSLHKTVDGGFQSSQWRR